MHVSVQAWELKLYFYPSAGGYRQKTRKKKKVSHRGRISRGHARPAQQPSVSPAKRMGGAAELGERVRVESFLSEVGM